MDEILKKLMEPSNFSEIVEDAKKLSKRKFIEFTYGIFGEDARDWSSLWNIPIIPTYECDTLINKELSEDEEDVVLDAIEETIESQIDSNTEAACIPFEYFMDPNGKIYDELIQDSIKNEDYSCAIFYYIPKLKELIKRFVKLEAEQTNYGELKTKITNYIAKVFTHERCHANAIYRIDENKTTIYGARGIYDEVEEQEKYTFYIEQDEVLTDTVAMMMQRYKYGESIEDCLLKVIESRGGKNPYEDMDDRMVLLLMSLFPEEITRWEVLGSHEERYNNLLAQKAEEVFGSHSEFARNIEETAGNYFRTMDKTGLTKEQ